MATLRVQDVRISRYAREAVAHHEAVVVVNRERRAFVIVHPGDRARSSRSARRGRPSYEAPSELGRFSSPDPAFKEDVNAVLEHAGSTPSDSWPQS